MYSRFQNRPNSEIRIPEHYSGCAFSAPPPIPEKKQEEPPRPHALPIAPARPSPPQKALPPAILPPSSGEHTKGDPHPFAPTPPPLSQGHTEKPFLPPGKAFPFSHGIGFDELLLLGLIILLSQSGQDGDMVLWLALLLFCV